jgi:hypothetical protein
MEYGEEYYDRDKINLYIELVEDGRLEASKMLLK